MRAFTFSLVTWAGKRIAELINPTEKLSEAKIIDSHPHLVTEHN
jgi:hypothetical protein